MVLLQEAWVHDETVIEALTFLGTIKYYPLFKPICFT